MSYTAVGQKAGGDGAVLEIFNLPRPVPGPKDLLIRVRGVSSNPTDYKHREGYAGSQGSMGGDQPLVVGYDGAGVVEEVGSEVAGFKVGDEVWWAGGYRTCCVTRLSR